MLLETVGWSFDGVMSDKIPDMPPYLMYVYPEGLGNIKWVNTAEKLRDNRILLSSYKNNNKEDLDLEVLKKPLSEGIMFNEVPNLPKWLTKFSYPVGWGSIKWGDAPEKLGNDRILLSSYKIKSIDINLEVYKKQTELKMLGDFEIEKVEYTFANSKLYRVVIVFEKEISFEKIKKFLVAQYGKPITDYSWDSLTTHCGIALMKEGQNPMIFLESDATLISIIESTK
jgi:hypothetical protein